MYKRIICSLSVMSVLFTSTITSYAVLPQNMSGSGQQQGPILVFHDDFTHGSGLWKISNMTMTNGKITSPDSTSSNIKFYDEDDNVIKSITFDSDWFDLDGYRYTVEKDYFEPILSQLESEFAKTNFDPEKPFAHLNADGISSITVCTQKNGLSSVTDKTAIKSIIQKLMATNCQKASDTETTIDLIIFLDSDRKCLLSVINLSPSGFSVTYPENITYTADTDVLQLVNSLVE